MVLRNPDGTFTVQKEPAAGQTVRYKGARHSPSGRRSHCPHREEATLARVISASLADSEDITLLVQASVVEMKLDREHGSARELVIRTLDGREGRVTAEVLVLACGGIETPRPLLNSDSQIIHGVANSSGMVGRCFMEHPHRTITPLSLTDAGLFEGCWTRRGSRHGWEFMCAVGLSAAEQETSKVLNARVHVFRTPEMEWSDTPRVGLFMEQAPNPDSRVLLSGASGTHWECAE